VSEHEYKEWLDAIHDLHRYCLWFRDKEGVIFSFQWFDTVSSLGGWHEMEI
jgi:hypothetical protein